MEIQNNKGKKYFFISDIHGFAPSMRDALTLAGYDKDNSEHILVVLGDIFDRGDDSMEVYDFLRSLPKERRVLVRGNHESLLKELVKRGQELYHDISNGTYDTLFQIAGIERDYLKKAIWNIIKDTKDDANPRSAELKMLAEKERVHRQLFDNPKLKEILDWIDSDEWVNYFELGDFIGVHSWIPCNRYTGKPLKDWEKASREDWEDAMWGDPCEKLLAGDYPRGKTIICGHWHASDFHKRVEGDPFGEDNFNLYFGKHCIAIDACTAWSGFCNVLVIDEKFNCYDKYGNLLKV